jgi:serine/threonine protein kinase
MTISEELSRLTNEEAADLTERVERFRAAWSPEGSADLAPALPPPGSRHRLAALVQIVLIDMERRAAVRLPFRVERYINLFPDDLSTNEVPAALLIAEYRLRHRYTDKPNLSEYQRWFPAQFDAIAEELRREPLTVPAMPELNGNTRATTIHPAAPGTLVDGRSGSRRNAPAVAAPGMGDVLPSDTPYRLIRKLGAGAFGEVYEARAPGEIPVAVKRIMRSVDHPSSRAEEEALETIKRLSHPYLLKMDSYWVLNDRLVIVMELADGSLADRIEYHHAQGRSGMPPEELIPLFEQAAKALDYLHTESVSHRDIKPENILILKGFAKLGDFGLARLHEHTMTVVGNTVGTPAYMAPEMWQQKVSLQSDQYSLAATYVRARLGRTLFSTNILVDMANSHINETPVLDPLPAAEQRVLLRALAKNPDHRYPSCQEFTEALRAAVFPPPEPPAPPVQRSGVLLTVAVAVVVALVVTLSTVYFVFRDDTSKKGPDEPVVQKPPEMPPEKPLPLINIPTGWTADPAGALTFGEKRYPLRLTRKVGEETLVAILIYPTGNGHPPPFYMLENKISNRVFAKVWNDVVDDKSTELHRFGTARSTLAPGTWADLVEAHGADAPVLGVTAPEAILVAQKLGGALPGFRQWLKATGELEREPRKLPAGKPVLGEPALGPAFRGIMNSFLPASEAWIKGADRYTKAQQLWNRDLALGREKPLPVAAGAGDESHWKIRQLVSNGKEWLGQWQWEPIDDSKRIFLSPTPGTSSDGVCVGQNYRSLFVMDFDAIREATEGYSIAEVGRVSVGFRIVLEP